jgi:thioredoxin-like negative regulator of GroEL
MLREHPLARLADSRTPTLVFLWASGCPACASMKPVVARWLRANEGRVKVMAVDLARVEWRAKKWEPELTPTCLVMFADGRLARKRLDGHEDDKVFAAFMETALARG